jgi:hypothetical protein
MYTFSFVYEPSRGPHRWLIENVQANNYEMAKLKLMLRLGDDLYKILSCERHS